MEITLATYMDGKHAFHATAFHLRGSGFEDRVLERVRRCEIAGVERPQEKPRLLSALLPSKHESIHRHSSFIAK